MPGYGPQLVSSVPDNDTLSRPEDAPSEQDFLAETACTDEKKSKLRKGMALAVRGCSSIPAPRFVARRAPVSPHVERAHGNTRIREWIRVSSACPWAAAG